MTAQPSPSQAVDGASLAQILLILRRRWRLLAAVWIATVAGVAVYTFTSTRLYRPQATLEIRPETPLVSSSDANDPTFMASRMMWENYYRTQESILTSPKLIDATLKALPEPVRRPLMDKPDPIKAFLEKLDIEKIRTSFILKIGYVDENREHATQIVNLLVSLYREDVNRQLRELKSGAVEVLSKETLPAIRKRVEDADQILQDFQASTGYVDFEEHHRSLIDTRRRMESRLTDLRLKRAKDRAELDALAAYGGNGVSGLFNPAFHSTRSLEPLAADRAKLASDLAKEEKLYKDRHPRVIELREQLRMTEEKIREAIRGTLKALETELIAVEGEEKALAKEVEKVERAMADAAKNVNRFKRLDAELLASKDVYNSYLKKHGETSATSGASLGSVRIVDDATVPQAPFKPRVLMNLALGGLVGLLLGIGFVFVTEQLDDRIQSPREVEAFVGLDVLAVIPRLTEASKAGEAPVMLDDQSALPEFEAFRSLRAEIVTRLEKLEHAKIVCVLSAMQSEGKSTVTANLAKVLAMEGRRLLIFDADMRRPSQRKLIGSPDGPGLEEVLRGGIPIEKAVQRSRIAGVDVLGAREGTSGAAELAGSPRFEETLQWARATYDLVLIDSAPVNQVSESPLIARRADLVILVIRERQTGRSAASGAKNRMLRLGVPIAGAVLNCALPHGGGYGGSYYGYYSSSYYGDGIDRPKG
ncbi:MAG TPA: polysaccharide biosynthesis tyrosine autokinase [Planctomycetota bacterium]